MNKNVAKIVLDSYQGKTIQRFNSTVVNGLDKNDKLILVILEILNRSRIAELTAIKRGDYGKFHSERTSQKHLEYFLDLLIKPSLVDNLFHDFYVKGENK